MLEPQPLIEKVTLETRDFVERDEVILGSKPEHVISMVHGIRDLGLWALDLKHYSRQNGLQIAIEPVSYGFTGVLSFLFRSFARSKERKVQNKLNEILLRHPDARHSLVAHSNGTKLVAAVIKHLPRKYDYIVFCGSVCKQENCPKAPEHSGTFINECSPKDIWPLFAEAINPFSYEATGVYGFRQPGVEDRFFTVNHGGCLTRRHFEKNILPVLLRNALTLGEKPRKMFPFGAVRWLRLLLIILAFAVFLLIRHFF